MKAVLARQDDCLRGQGQFGDALVVVRGVLCAVLAGLVAGLAGPVVAAVLLAVLLFGACAYRPVFAVYAYLLVLPFVAGIGRDTLVPGVRPNEALLVLLMAGACVGGYVRLLRGDAIPLRLKPIDAPLACFVLFSTVWPLALLMLRGSAPQRSDLAAVLPVLKLTALFLLVRLTVHTDQQRRRCIRLIVWPAGGLAAVAVLQTLGFGPVLTLLKALWQVDAGGASDRGSATLGSSIATGDYIIAGLALLLCCGTREMLGRRERIGLGLVLAAGVLASGQFSTWISAVVAAVLILRRFPQVRRRAARFLPLAGLAAVVGAPAFLGRMADFAQGYALPRSWLGRWDNLTSFYLPRLGDFHFVLGVSPNSVLPAPETWRNVIYLESGYLDFLWVGGIPLLAAFAWLSVTVLRETRRLGERPDALGACAATLEIAWWMVVVLSLIDIHLVVRGFGDLLFVLLAITSRRLADDRNTAEDPAVERSRTV
ncbi:hypothetical protein GCM10025787_25250 [Saccharopolyspora rosea]